MDSSRRRPLTPTIEPPKKLTPSKSPQFETSRKSPDSRNPDSRTPEPKPTRSRSQLRSHQQPKSKFTTQMQVMQKQLINNKNKLCSCMQIYEMLESTVQSQRCLQHNNTLSLYCMNQRRILCVNCLYGIHRHRSHKVVPLKDCMNEVYEDNRKLKVIIEEEIKRLDFYSKMAQDNINSVQTQMKRLQNQLQMQHIRKIDELKAKFQKSKKLITQTYTPISQQCRKVKIALDDFRFNIWKAYTMQSDQKSTQQNQTMKQLLFVTIVELCQFRNRIIGRNQLDSMARNLKRNF